MEREVGGGVGMGKTCKPKAFSFQCMTKFTTNKKNLKKNVDATGPHMWRKGINSDSGEDSIIRDVFFLI